MRRSLSALCALLIAVLACGQDPAPLTAPPSTPTVALTVEPEALWYLTRGEAKSDQAWGVDTDSAGNIYTAGYYQSPAASPFFDMVIYKFTPSGDELWRTQWGGNLQEKAFVVTISEPYVYIGGLTHTAMALTEADMAILELDTSTGQVLWTFQWGQGFGYEEVDGLVVDGDSVYVSGWTTGEKTGGDIALLKLNRSDGSLVWAKTWGGEKFDSADGQMVVDDSSIYVSGRTNGANILAGGEALVVKFSKETGEYIRHQTWGGPIFSDGLGMTSDGTYLYIVGLTLDRGNGGQIFLLKYDKELTLHWEALWGEKGGESARAVEVDETGAILIAGNTDSLGAGKTDITLLQFNQDGKLNQSQLWGGPLDDNAQGLVIDGDSAYIVGSTENKSQGMNDALLIKADARDILFPSP